MQGTSEQNNPAGKGAAGDKFFIKTFGCQMNYHDTERMQALLSEQGYAEAETADDASLIIFNSCSIRDKAEQKAMSAAGWVKKAKRANPDLIVGFAGCVAQQESKKVFQSAPHLNFVMGTDSIDALPEIVYRAKNGESKILMTGFDKSQDYSLETKVMPGKSSAYVNIMKGCDNFCTYCIVPFTRGREKSRQPEEVVADIEKLLREGIVDVMLLGQNVNSYGKSLGGRTKGYSFAKLLRMIEAMADRLDAEGVTDPTGDGSQKPRGLLRLRYTTSHPKDFDDEMIDVHGDLKRLVPHLHLPVQSGSENVLRAMKRYVPIDLYIDRLDRLRERVPGIALSTDIIVGFPTEEEEDYQQTMQLLERIRFDQIYAYAYSARPGTAALKLGDTVPEEVKKERLHKLQHRQTQIQAEKNLQHMDEVFEVLVEGPSKTDFKMLTGRTVYNKILNFPKPDSVESAFSLTGRFLPVKVTATTAFALKGEAQLDA